MELSEVRKEVARYLNNQYGKGSEDSLANADAIIPLAQLPTEPIAEATDKEWEQFMKDYTDETRKQGVSGFSAMHSALNYFISRRNSPPKVDPLVEMIYKSICDFSEPFDEPGIGIAHDLSKNIAAAVRELAALDALKGE